MNINKVTDWTYVNVPAVMAEDVENWFAQQNITEYSLMSTEDTPDDVPAGLHYPYIDTYDPDEILVIKSHIDHNQLDLICRGIWLYG